MKATAKQMDRMIDRLYGTISRFDDYVEIDPEGCAASLRDVTDEAVELVRLEMRATVPDSYPGMLARQIARAEEKLLDVAGEQERATHAREGLRRRAGARSEKV
jgi:hypothetical protein